MKEQEISDKMKKHAYISSRKVATLSIIGINLICIIIVSAQGLPKFAAMFVFGDSLVDDGNNNYLNSWAKSNYVPYGIDYGWPTGRFCNGKTIIDFLGDLLGLPYLPPFASTFIGGTNILKGVNYASAAAGVLDETGAHLGERYSLSQQVQNFAITLSQLKGQMNEEEVRLYLEKTLVVINIGSNDYINNYLMPSVYSSSYTYNFTQFADILTKNYATQIMALYNMGLRKFLLGGVGPLGCVPNQLATGLASPGKCVSSVNDMAGLYNVRLRSLVDQLNKENHPKAIFVYGNTFGAFSEILDAPSNYGFNVTDRGCCGAGRNSGQITCLPFSVPCTNRDEYVFWDAYHPTQAVNRIIAQRAYTGSPSDCYPMNLKEMAQV